MREIIFGSDKSGFEEKCTLRGNEESYKKEYK